MLLINTPTTCNINSPFSELLDYRVFTTKHHMAHEWNWTQSCKRKYMKKKMNKDTQNKSLLLNSLQACCLRCEVWHTYMIAHIGKVHLCDEYCFQPILSCKVTDRMQTPISVYGITCNNPKLKERSSYLPECMVPQIRSSHWLTNSKSERFLCLQLMRRITITNNERSFVLTKMTLKWSVK